MKRGIFALITAVLLAGAGAVHAYIPINLVANGGFDGLSGSEPNTTTTSVGEWFSIGTDDFGITSEDAVFGATAPCVRWKYAWGTGHAIQQKLGVVVEASKDYEVNLSHAINVSSGKPNDNQFEVSIWTSSTVDGVYAQAVGLGSVYSTNTPGTFASYEATFSAASMAPYVGEYMLIRIERMATGVDYGLHIDDVRFGVPGTPPAPHPTLATFDTTFTRADSIVSELSSSWTGHTVPRTDANSTDGTFGTISIPAAEATLKGAVTVDSSKPVATLTLNNTGAKDVYLDDFHFDVARFWPNAPQDFVLTTSGDITTTTLTNGYGVYLINGKNGDFDDYDLALSNLTDNVLSPTEQAVFTWTFSNWGDAAATIIDNVLVGGTVSEDLAPFDAVLTLNPSDQLTMGFTDAGGGIASNSFTVSYAEGYPVTNVNISSVSVVSPSEPGFSVSPTSLTLNDPGPSNELVTVTFDNSTAGLTARQSATGLVEVIWNEVGSASSSTSSLPVSATFVEVSAENILVAYNDSFISPEIFVQGLDATLTGPIVNSSAGSTDTTYGTLLGDASMDGGCQIVNDTIPTITLEIENNTGADATLDALHFDAARRYAASLDDVTVSMTGDLGSETLLVHSGLSHVYELGDYDDFDITLTNLTDRMLADGESVTFSFAFTDGGLGTGISAMDNIAVLGSATPTIAPAVLSRASDSPWESLGVSGLDTSVSQPIDLVYAAGELNTNISITGVSISNVTHAGAMSASGSFPVALSTPDITNSAVFSLVFDNTIANLSPGEYAEYVVQVEWTEPGRGNSIFEFSAYGTRPADVPENGVIALFHTEFLTPDAAVNGVLGRFDAGNNLEFDKGSMDATYGSLADPAASTNSLTSWRFTGRSPVASVTITNQSPADIELSTLNFDMGRWYGETDVTGFTLGIAGDVTENAAFMTAAITELGWENNDYDDHDVDLSGLADHTLGAGESVTFTFTLDPVDASSLDVGIWIDNIALMGAMDPFGVWAAETGLDVGNGGAADNPDGDSRDNFMEYATGGDPLTAEAAAVTWVAEDAGTEWFYHVHRERTDDPSLSFSVTLKGDLTSGSWGTAGLDLPATESAPVDGIKSVTNRTDMGTMEFIRVKVN